MKNILFIGSISLAILATLTLIMFSSVHTPTANAAGYQVTNIGLSASSTRVVAVTSSTRLSATTTNPTDPANGYIRTYVSICNPNANPVYLRLDGDKPASASAGYTTVIAAAAGYNVCYQITDQNQYFGSITASSTNQTSTNVGIAEYVQ